MSSKPYRELTDKEKEIVQLNNAYRAFEKEFSTLTLQFRFEIVDKGDYSKLNIPYLELENKENEYKGDYKLAFFILKKTAFKRYLENHPLRQASFKVNKDGTITIDTDEKGKQVLTDFYAPKDNKLINIEKETKFYSSRFGAECKVNVPIETKKINHNKPRPYVIV